MTIASTLRTAGLRMAGVLAAGVLLAGAAQAAPITYTINQTIGAGSVTGTVETTGTTGVLSASDITGWNLQLNGVGASYTLTDAMSVVQVVGGDLTATATSLYFDFDGSDGGYLLFQESLFSGTHYFCDAASASVCYQGATVTPESIFDASAQNVAMSGNQLIGTAGASPVPEPATLTLLGGALIGVAALARRRRAR